MVKRGGSSTQSGIRYQILIGIEWILKMFEEDAIEYIVIEGDGHVNDIEIHSYDGPIIYQEIKQKSTEDQWTIKKLEDTIKKMYKQHEEDHDCEIHFVSDSQANALKNLVEKAKITKKLKNFKSKLNEKDKNNFNKLGKLLGVSELLILYFLERLTIKGGYTSQDILENNLKSLLSKYGDSSILFNCITDLVSRYAKDGKNIRKNEIKEIFGYYTPAGSDTLPVKSPPIYVSPTSNIEGEYDEDLINREIEKAKQDPKYSSKKYSGKDIKRGTIPFENGRILAYEVSHTKEASFQIWTGERKEEEQVETPEIRSDIEISSLDEEERTYIHLVSFFKNIALDTLECISINILKNHDKLTSLIERGILSSSKKESDLPKEDFSDIVTLNIGFNAEIITDDERTSLKNILNEALKICKNNIVNIIHSLIDRYQDLAPFEIGRVKGIIIDNEGDNKYIWLASKLAIFEEDMRSYVKNSLEFDVADDYTHRVYANLANTYIDRLMKKGPITTNIKIDETEINELHDFISRAYHEKEKLEYQGLLSFSYVLRGDYVEGIREAIKLLNKDSGHINALNALIFAYIKRNELEKSLYYLDILSSKVPLDFYLLLTIGSILKGLERNIEAIEYFQSALELNPAHPEANSHLGICYYNINEFEEARKYLQKSLKLDPQCENGLFGMGDIAKNVEDDFISAIKYYEKALNVNPNNISGWVGLAECNFKIGNIEKHDEVIKKIDKIGVFDKKTLKNLIAYNINTGQFEEAKKWAEKYITKYPNDNKGYTFLGVIFNNISNLNKAKKLFQKSSELNPEDPEPIYLIGHSYFQSNELEKSERSINECLSLDDKHINALILKSKIENNKGRYLDALKISDKVNEINPKSIDNILVRGYVYANLKKYSDALELFQGLKKRNVDINCEKYIGKIQLYMNNFVDSEKSLLIAQKNDINDLDIIRDLGFLYFNMKEFDTSKEYLSSFYDKKPNYFDVNQLLGRIYIQEKEYQKGLFHFRKAYEINRKHQMNLIYYLDLLIINKNYQKALRIVDKSLKSSPSNNTLNLMRVEILIKQKKKKHANNFINNISKYFKNSSDFYKFIGDIYQRNKDYDHAIKYYKMSNKQKINRNALFELGLCFINKKNDKDAIKVFSSLIDNFGPDKGAFSNIGLLYSNIGDYKKGREFLLKAIDVDPNDTSLKTNLVAIAIKDQDIINAGKILKTLYDENPDDKDIIKRYAEYNFRYISNVELALELYNKLYEIEPTVDNKIEIANLFQQKRDYKRALEIYEKLYHENSDNIKIISMILICYSAMADEINREKYKDILLQMNSNDYFYNFGLCIYYHYKRKDKQAIEYGLKCLDINKKNANNITIYIIIGNSYNNIKEYDLSIKYFDQAIESGSNDFNLYRLGALPYIQLGNFEKAIDLLETHIERFPTDLENYKLLSRLHEKNHNIEKCMEIVNKLIKDHSDDKELYYIKGNAFVGQKEFDEAIKNYEYLKSIDKSVQPILNIADIYFMHLKDYNSALEKYTESLKFDTENWKVWRNLGQCYYFLGESEKEVESYVKALSITNDIEVNLLLLLTYMKRKENEKAINLYKTILKEKESRYKYYNYIERISDLIDGKIEEEMDYFNNTKHKILKLIIHPVMEKKIRSIAEIK